MESGFVDLLVATPRGRHPQRLTRHVHRRGEPSRRREQDDLGRPIIGTGGAPFVAVLQIVAITTARVDDRAERGQHPDQVPLPHRAPYPGQLLVRVRGPEQIGEHQPFELGPQLGRGRWAWSQQALLRWVGGLGRALRRRLLGLLVVQPRRHLRGVPLVIQFEQAV